MSEEPPDDPGASDRRAGDGESRAPSEGVEVGMGEFAVIDEAREDAIDDSVLYTAGVGSCLAVGVVLERTDGERVVALAHVQAGAAVRQGIVERVIEHLCGGIGGAELDSVRLASGARGLGIDHTADEMDDIADRVDSCLDVSVVRTDDQGLAVDRRDGFVEGCDGFVDCPVNRAPDADRFIDSGRFALRNRLGELPSDDADIEPIDDVSLHPAAEPLREDTDPSPEPDDNGRSR